MRTARPSTGTAIIGCSPHATAAGRCSSAFFASRRTREAMPLSPLCARCGAVSRVMAARSIGSSSTRRRFISDSNASAVRSAADERFAQCSRGAPSHDRHSVAIWHEETPAHGKHACVRHEGRG